MTLLYEVSELKLHARLANTAIDLARDEYIYRAALAVSRRTGESLKKCKSSVLASLDAGANDVALDFELLKEHVSIFLKEIETPSKFIELTKRQLSSYKGIIRVAEL